MGGVIDFIREAIAIYNLPFTMLLGAAFCYWLLVMIGALDWDFDFFDFGDGGADVPDVNTSHSGGALGGTMLSLGKYFGFAHVPTAIWGSFFVIFLWLGSMLSNYYLNGEPGNRSLLTAALLMIPVGIVSLFAAKLITWPYAKMFSTLEKRSSKNNAVLQQIGSVTTTSLDHQHGQVEVVLDDLPLLINARLKEAGPTLRKGDPVRVIESVSEGLFYYVTPYQPNTLP